MQWLFKPTYLRVALVLLIVVAITGCARQLAYRFADTYIAWQVRDYVDLNRDQRDQLDIAINDFLQWHAETEMPRYLILLEQIDEDIAEQNFSASRLTYYQQALAQRWQAVRDAVTEPALELLPGLSDEQVAQLIESIAANIQSRADEYQEQTTAERREDGVENVRKLVERFLGSVNEEQEQAIQTWTQAMPDMADEWIEYRVSWAESFRGALQKRSDRAEFEALLIPLIEDPHSLRGETLQSKGMQSRELSQVMVLRILQATDAEQRSYLRDEISSLAEDLRGMMRIRGVS
ncbi:DUF6279 family lipoprotein [Aliidiomarina sp. Khilg15.8]